MATNKGVCGKPMDKEHLGKPSVRGRCGGRRRCARSQGGALGGEAKGERRCPRMYLGRGGRHLHEGHGGPFAMGPGLMFDGPMGMGAGNHCGPPSPMMCGMMPFVQMASPGLGQHGFGAHMADPGLGQQGFGAHMAGPGLGQQGFGVHMTGPGLGQHGFGMRGRGGWRGGRGRGPRFMHHLLNMDEEETISLSSDEDENTEDETGDGEPHKQAAHHQETDGNEMPRNGETGKKAETGGDEGLALPRGRRGVMLAMRLMSLPQFQMEYAQERRRLHQQLMRRLLRKYAAHHRQHVEEVRAGRQQHRREKEAGKAAEAAAAEEEEHMTTEDVLEACIDKIADIEANDDQPCTCEDDA